MIEHGWSRTVGVMAAEGVVVHWDCHHCKRHGTVDPAKIAEVKGETFSLWDRLRICPECDGIITYSAALRDGNWPKRLLTPKGQQMLLDALDVMWWERRRR